ncbi:MAG: zinc ribbon domain-containing protein [Thermoleophilia bacterium]
MAPRLTGLFPAEPNEEPGDTSGTATPDGQADEQPVAEAALPTTLTAAQVVALRRDRRAHMRDRERRIRDLGGLVLEMVRRGRLSTGLLERRASEVLGVEREIHAIDAVLRTAVDATPGPTIASIPLTSCRCGAELAPGANFCANCGRPVEVAPPRTCAACGRTSPASARFCGGCGAALTAAGQDAP